MSLENKIDDIKKKYDEEIRPLLVKTNSSNLAFYDSAFVHPESLRYLCKIVNFAVEEVFDELNASQLLAEAEPQYKASEEVRPPPSEKNNTEKKSEKEIEEDKARKFLQSQIKDLNFFDF